MADRGDVGRVVGKGVGELEAAGLFERRDPRVERRVRLEETGEGAASSRSVLERAPGALDPQVRDRRVGVAHRGGVELEPAQGERDRLGVVEDLGGGGVGEVLAACARATSAAGPAAIGASRKPTSARTSTIRPPRPRERPPPNTIERKAMSASSAITPANTTASVIRRVSRLRTCEISWAITASSSRFGIVWSSPVVTPTKLEPGRSPVANAFGAGSSTTRTSGVTSRPAAIATFSTRRCSGRIWSGGSSCAPVIAATMLRELMIANTA